MKWIVMLVLILRVVIPANEWDSLNKDGQQETAKTLAMLYAIENRDCKSIKVGVDHGMKVVVLTATCIKLKI